MSKQVGPRNKVRQRFDQQKFLVFWIIFTLIWIPAHLVMEAPQTRVELFVRDLLEAVLALLVYGIYTIASRWRSLARRTS